MYTFGSPKNQNRCRYKIESPPPGSKKDVFEFRSVNNIVMAPANPYYNDNNTRAVIPTDQTNNGIRSGVILIGRILIIS